MKIRDCKNRFSFNLIHLHMSVLQLDKLDYELSVINSDLKNVEDDSEVINNLNEEFTTPSKNGIFDKNQEKLTARYSISHKSPNPRSKNSRIDGYSKPSQIRSQKSEAKSVSSRNRESTARIGKNFAATRTRTKQQTIEPAGETRTSR